MNEKIDEELNKILIAILSYKNECKKENISDDDIETVLLSVLESAGINFSR
jgi:hypothetical protein